MEGKISGRGRTYDVLPPLLGAAKARLGASSSRMRQWVESSPCGQLELCFGVFPPLPSQLWHPYQWLPPYRPNYALTLSLYSCNMSLSLQHQHYYRSHSSPSPVLKSVPWGAGAWGARGWGGLLKVYPGGLGLGGLGARVGPELRALQP